MRSFHEMVRRATSPHNSLLPPARRPTSSKGRQSTDQDALGRSRTVKSARSSLERGHHHLRASQDEPIPPLPIGRISGSTLASPISAKFRISSTSNASQMRIYINDMQKFNMVEVNPDTSAKDVVDIIASQGDLKDDVQYDGGWMIWEVSQEHGMGM